MAVTLGKRKRRTDVRAGSPAAEDASSDDETARALFQRAFEAKFKPLEKAVIQNGEDGEDESEDDGELEEDSDWSGLSEGEEEVQIVEATHPSRPDAHEMKAIKKSFMVSSIEGIPAASRVSTDQHDQSSKPPTEIDAIFQAPQKSAKPKDPAAEDNPNEALNLKNDLALQRLLKEAHLLGPSSFGPSSTTTPQGHSRVKALDLRLQDLGAKTSVLQQEKMPLSHRRGIVAKAAQREASRRKEAAENGVVLEKARMKAKPAGKRARGIAGPSVGKFRGGTLRLRERDVRSIQNAGRKGKRR